MTFRPWLRTLSVYLDRRVITVLFLGFASGLPFPLMGGTLNAWLTDSGASRTSIGLFALVGLPYALKFAWAPLIDRMRIPVLTAALGRRRGWAIATQTALVAALCFLATTDPAADLWRTALAALVAVFCAASQDIVIDAYRVELLEPEEQGAGAAAITLGWRFGFITSGAGGLALAAVLPWQTVYLLMAAMVGIGMAAVLLSREPQVRSSPQAEELERAAADWLARRPHLPPWAAMSAGWLYGAVVAPFLQFMTRPYWPLILVFIATYKLGDSYVAQMQMTFFLQTGFTKVQVAGITQFFGLLCAMVGVLLGGLVVARLGIVRSLLIGGVLQMATNLAFVAVAQTGADATLLALAIGLDNVTAGMGTAALVAYLSSLCDAAYTATQYALLSSFISVGRDFMASGSGLLADALGWTGFFLATMLLAWPALLLLVWLGRNGAVPRTRPGLSSAADTP